MRKVVTALLTAACLAGTAACGAGQVAGTAEQRTSAPGSLGEVGSLLVRNAQFVWSDPVPGDVVHPVGGDAELQVTIVNDEVGAGGPDRLVAVSSPVATSGRIVGDATIPDGQTLVSGYDGPVGSITLDGATEVQIVLEGLTTPLRAGLTYPVVFTFADAGDLVLPVGVENPPVLPPRAWDEEEDPAILGTGPDPLVVPDDE